MSTPQTPPDARPERTASAGARDTGARSDCLVTVWATPPGREPERRIASKVLAMYGSAIHALVQSMLAQLRADDLSIAVEDRGALPFTLAARVEAAVRLLRPGAPAIVPDVLGMPEAPPYATVRDRLRRSRLYLPGNTPKLFVNAGLHRPDAVILDLEDSVPAPEKTAARLLVRNALRAVDFCGAERMVRINALPEGLDDVRALAPFGVHTFVLPKVEDPDQVLELSELLDTLEDPAGDPAYLLPTIESARGALQAWPIARSSTRVVALSLGLEDYTRDIGAERTREGRESQWACGQVINAARAAGVQPLGSVYSDVGDDQGFHAWAVESRRMGFEGVACLHPRQIRTAHAAFAPTQAEVDAARRIAIAFEAAQAAGVGVAAVDGKMVDAPVAARARRTLRLAGDTEGRP